MRIFVNGKEQVDAKENATISDVLFQNGVKRPELVSVQHRGEFLEQNKFDTTFIKENDEVEFLYFMGGGSK